ncbi:hypothetical protein Pan216_42250 [Planctomycetes bacterium Pan216]|uniref:Putative restriction endonuclease domain-containing protein n=1 Tax=Kolteria novifilia TaxID=2527975 RepID=A0A518B8Q2_9BACT|nr:hypothetical protein Pan216_42250 [Planctomycetes bacterium Pan216]
MAIADKFITAEEYEKLPDPGYPTELVRGEVVMMNVPGFRHGETCLLTGRIVGNFVAERQIGRVLSNDAGITTNRGPDTVRGADIAYYSYQRVPKSESPKGYPTAKPEVVFEVRSPSDRSGYLLAKVAEYLDAGVLVVCVIDTETERVHVYRQEDVGQILEGEQELTLPELDPEFHVAARDFFA